MERRHPEVILNKGTDLIQERLVQIVDNSPSSSQIYLQFKRTLFRAGVLWMTCENECSVRVSTLEKIGSMRT